jgi:hypothetical protein
MKHGPNLLKLSSLFASLNVSIKFKAAPHSSGGSQLHRRSYLFNLGAEMFSKDYVNKSQAMISLLKNLPYPLVALVLGQQQMNMYKRIIRKGDTGPIHEPNAVASRLLLSKLCPLLKHFL